MGQYTILNDNDQRNAKFLAAADGGTQNTKQIQTRNITKFAF